MDSPPHLPYLPAIVGCEDNETDISQQTSDSNKTSDVMDNPFMRPAKKARRTRVS